EYRENEDLPTGEERVVTEGVKGEITKEYELIYHNGELVDKILISEKTTKKPVKKVIEVGVPKVTYKTTETRDYPMYEVINRENPDMYIGETRVVQEGMAGEKITTIKYTYEDGVLVSEEVISVEVISEPIDAIIEYGTKERPEPTPDPEEPEEGEDSKPVISYEYENVMVQPDTIYVKNPDLPKGVERVVQEGVFGQSRRVYKLT